MADESAKGILRIATGAPLELAPNLYLLGNRYFSLYLLRGRRASALVEVGVSATVPTVVSQLEGLLAAPDYLVVTHPHADHLTGLSGLRKRFPSSRVVAAAGAAEFANHGKIASGRVSEDEHMTEFLVERGQGQRAAPEAISAGWLPDLEVADGESLDLGGLELRFKLHHGHAPGGLTVQIPALRAVLASDALGYQYDDGHFYPVYFTGLAAYLTALDDFQRAGLDLLGLGHNGALSGQEISTGLDTARMDTRTMDRRIREGLAAGVDLEAIRDGVYTDSYREALQLYSPENIKECCRLLVKRSADAAEAARSNRA